VSDSGPRPGGHVLGGSDHRVGCRGTRSASCRHIGHVRRSAQLTDEESAGAASGDRSRECRVSRGLPLIEIETASTHRQDTSRRRCAAFHPAPTLLNCASIQQRRCRPRGLRHLGIRSDNELIQRLALKPVRGVEVGATWYAVPRCPLRCSMSALNR
jgi:hypothetical protein